MKKLILIMVLITMPQVLAATMTRNIPNEIGPGQSFTVTYYTAGTSGDYGVSVVDTITGGCTPSDIKFLLISPATSHEEIVTAPSSGSCTFRGDYKYGTLSEVDFPDATVIVSGDCVPNWVCDSWSACVSGQQTRQCNDGCGDTRTETRSCCIPNWICGEWSACVNNQQTRQCNDGCGDSRTETQACGTCTSGDTQSCVVDGCAGIQTCANGQWGSCIKTDPDCGTCGNGIVDPGENCLNCPQDLGSLCGGGQTKCIFRIGSTCITPLYLIIIGFFALIILDRLT